ncbi:hypothetical protein G7090_00385 [Leclercia sp. 29361]|uniref:TIR domain-containing protein n=1 Tax=Leclercia sp. 29361 TaxID=2714951 RepID=UPI001407ABBA|nr:TIR domain-containing protein [Leclercia sp. 29361]QIK11921.1 hypothetical protein G7090_00385 [Leclercia sp. 29361]
MSTLGNYCAFYVAEPFNPSSLGAHATRDFVYYNLLRSWKGKDSSFPFHDSHSSTYSVRDGSDWETTLKPRLRQRLRNSKNLILFLSSSTINSRALREEIDYAINSLYLPIIVVYPELSTKESLRSGETFSKKVKDLWSIIPVFRDSKKEVPVLHVPMDKEIIKKALNNTNFQLGSQKAPNDYFYN